MNLACPQMFSVRLVAMAFILYAFIAALPLEGAWSAPVTNSQAASDSRFILLQSPGDRSVAVWQVFDPLTGRDALSSSTYFAGGLVCACHHHFWTRENI